MTKDNVKFLKDQFHFIFFQIEFKMSYPTFFNYKIDVLSFQADVVSTKNYDLVWHPTLEQGFFLINWPEIFIVIQQMD